MLYKCCVFTGFAYIQDKVVDVTFHLAYDIGSMLVQRLWRLSGINPTSYGYRNHVGVQTGTSNAYFFSRKNVCGWWRLSRAKRQYLLTLKVSRYCLLALQSSVSSHWSNVVPLIQCFRMLLLEGEITIKSPKLTYILIQNAQFSKCTT